MSTASVCERCGGSLVSITLTITAEPRTMRSCSSCDHRSWVAGSRRIDLDLVLNELSEHRRSPAASYRR